MTISPISAWLNAVMGRQLRWGRQRSRRNSRSGGAILSLLREELPLVRARGRVAVETAHEGRGHGVVDLPEGRDDVPGAGDMKARTKFATPSCPSIRPRLVSQADSVTRSAFNFIPVISRIWRRPSW